MAGLSPILDTESVPPDATPSASSYEQYLGNPAGDRYTIQSTAAGVRSWVASAPVISARDYGARPNGINCTTSIQNALNAAYAAGIPVVQLPEIGQYLCTGALSIPRHVRLLGPVPGPTEAASSIFVDCNTAVLATTGLVDSFITLDWGSAVSDLAIYYPNQVGAAAATPTTYPWTIVCGDSGWANCKIERLHIINAYQAIQLVGGRHHVKDCNIGSLKTGLQFYGNGDTCFASNITFQMFYGTVIGDPLQTWVFANGSAIVIGEGGVGGNLQASNIRSFARKYGVWLKSGLGVCQFNNMYLDNHITPVFAEATDEDIGVVFTNLLAGGVGVSSTFPVHVTGTACVRVAGGAFWGFTSPYCSVASTAFLSVTGVDNADHPANPLSNGPNNLGVLSSPAVPATGVALVNPYPHKVLIYIRGGTLSAVAINGQGLAAATSPIIIGPNQTITLAYTVAPTWDWIGL